MEDLLLELPSKDELSNAEAALKEKLESMKRSRSGLLSFVTKLQNELDCLFEDLLCITMHWRKSKPLMKLC